MRTLILRLLAISSASPSASGASPGSSLPPAAAWCSEKSCVWTGPAISEWPR